MDIKDIITFITAQSYILLYYRDKSTYKLYREKLLKLIISLYSSELELACSWNAYSSIAYSSTSVYSKIAYSTSTVAGRHRYRVRIRRFREYRFSLV